MKTINRVTALAAMIVTSTIAFAQDKKVDIDINTKGDDSGMWGSPALWIIGAAIFILLLVALLRGRRSDA
jgi:hypothetical protein